MNPAGTIGATLDALEASGAHDVPSVEDPLAEALHYLRMDGMFYCRSELTAPWGLDLPEMPDCLWFHVVTSGAGTLVLETGDAVHVGEGDIVVLPHGSAHLAQSDATAPTPLVFDLPHDYISRSYAVLRHGGYSNGGRSDGGLGEHTTIVCGVVQLGHPAAAELLAVLPSVIHIAGATDRAEWEWLPSVLSLMASEAQSAQPGGETVITRLCDVLVIQAIRSWIDTDPAARQGWLGALRDPTIGRAISLIHGDPSNHWTVDSLAREVAMSRSGFSARFSALVGVSPKQYVTRWRMRLAQDLLHNDSLPILAIATQLGYQSEAAFSRAFKREMGTAPSHARKLSPVGLGGELPSEL